MSYEKVRAELGLAIQPEYLGDPSTCIFKQITKSLLQYSHPLQGFPLSFVIGGILPAGKILPDGSVYVDCLVTFYILRISPGDVVCSSEGTLCGIFGISVENEENYTGDVIVKRIEKDVVYGIKVGSEGDSDF